MVAMKEFSLWCLEAIPAVLLEPPFSAFVGLVLVFFTFRLFLSLMNLK